MAQCRRGPLRQTDPAAAQVRGLQRHCRSPGRYQPVPRRDQSKPQALHLDRRSRRHHRKGPARETGVRVDPLEQATAVDPDYGPAYSRMASLHLRWVAQGWSEDEIADRRMAASAAQLAIERDRNDAVALAIFGHIQSYLLKDYSVATDYFQRAMAVGPS